MDTRRLTRSETDRMIGGVCGGLAEYLQIDAALLRIGFVVLAMIGGTGVALYLAMWLIVPRSSRTDAPPRDVVKDNVAEGRQFAEDTVSAARDAFQRLRRQSGTSTGEQPPWGGDQPPSAGEPSTGDQPPPAGAPPAAPTSAEGPSPATPPSPGQQPPPSGDEPPRDGPVPPPA